MLMQDLFVGGVSIGLGLASLWTALLNSEAPFQLAMPKLVERQFGRFGARVVFALLGAALVTAGVAVIAGFAPGWLGIPSLETP